MAADSAIMAVKILSSAKYVLAFVFVFGVVVFIHELGHFIAARIFGVKVEQFALGMGPKLFSWKKGETEYLLAAFPIGGYVKMAGEEPGSVTEGKLSKSDYYGQPPLHRLLITFSGPLMNFVLALIFFVVIFLSGVPSYPPVVGPVAKGSTSEKAGILSGDVISSVDGKPVRNFSDALNFIDYTEKDKVFIEVSRGSGKKTFEVGIAKEKTENFLGEEVEDKNIGIDVSIDPVISDIVPGTPASLSKLKKGDRVKSLNGMPVLFWQDITTILNEKETAVADKAMLEKEDLWNSSIKSEQSERRVKIVSLDFEREGKASGKFVVLHVQKQTKQVKSKNEKSPNETFRWIVGIQPPDNTLVYRYPVGESIIKGSQRIYDTTVLILKVFVALVEKRLNKDALGGPIMIGKMIGKATDLGFIQLLAFTAVLSLNLGIINYFPFPALDGGHMAFALLEMIRRKPLSMKVMEYIQKTGFAFLIGLIIYVSYQDVLRLAGG